MASSISISDTGDGLRKRIEQGKIPDSSKAVNDSLPKESKLGTNVSEEDKKTFGRTPDGIIFAVPQTHDMVSQLLDPRQPKNLSDALVLIILVIHIMTLYYLPSNFRRPAFAIIFLFWRACYNVGIGFLLHMQSNYRWLTLWAKKTGIFDVSQTANQPYSWLSLIIRRELEIKIPNDYQFEKAPIEYNTWLVFRKVVDLILMCDFTSYCLFAIACGHRPVDESFLMTTARWSVGIMLVGFNLWVKLDAHRVVKDYAWYWGDFFYLIDQKLTFDGVFEMAPHPMYSVGYAGYYGISMMAASYSVLLISVIAQAAQFAFLIYVENPHIEKTYNSPPPRKRTISLDGNHSNEKETLTLEEDHDDKYANDEWDKSSAPESVSIHHYLGFGNFDLFRSTDLSVLLIQALMVILTFMTPSTLSSQVFFFFNAVFWRIWYTVGLGVILDKQSKAKMWTRHFVKYGESAEEAWKQWKGMYYLSMTMCYASFIAASYKMYSIPNDWAYGLVLFKHILGTGLVALQVWTAVSIYESLGEFGWFFGDFFFDKGSKLTYSGIYRYLNNPERIIGLASIWGAVLITNSPAIFFLAFISHTLTLGFIQLVEKPHMQKLYGRNLRAEAGLTKGIKRSLPPPLQRFQGSVDRVLEDTSHFVREFVDAARPKLAAGVSTFVRDTSSLFSQYPARITITRLAPDLAGYNPRDYSLEILGVSSNQDSRKSSEKIGKKDCSTSQSMPAQATVYEPLVFDYGSPITVKWQAPAHCSKDDWIGLYKVADNASREVTRVSSAGRWLPTLPSLSCVNVKDKSEICLEGKHGTPLQQDRSCQTAHVQGEIVFEGDKLWWTQGVFEFRYHHDGKHNVMAISYPFEISIRRFDEAQLQVEDDNWSRAAVETALLPVIRNCLDRDSNLAPNSVDDCFGILVERDGKYAKRVAFAVHQMFGLEFLPKVIIADGSVRKLARRICIAKKALVRVLLLWPQIPCSSLISTFL
ncbi:CHO2/Phosphatidylethanolamine methyltransferase (PEMT) [Blumeria hordei DH14]|uniref:Phosphatidylethanolamine N-methyltransferase n=1 Tax=Blumeria graminis f. sp. hordei (strain DH14) TaxID=546991 RepID=N1JE18_BLUG1|nr:CHO2/Phosphatidylethanolamine methyltransferase (PEMT) [Blumeria hordei DH14]